MRNPATKAACAALMWLACLPAFWSLPAPTRAADMKLTLSVAAPPPALFKDAEIYLISGLKSQNNPKGRAKGVRVTVDRPGHAVVLFLGDNGHELDWRVDLTPGTTLRGIVLTSREPSPIFAERAVPAYAWPQGRAIWDGPGTYNFALLQEKLQQTFGITRLAGAAVSSGLSDLITFSKVDPAPALAYERPVAAPPLSDHEFLLYGAGRSGPYQRFGLEGPRPGLTPASAATRRIFSRGSWVVAGDGGTECGVTGELLRCIELESGDERMISLPDDPRGKDLSLLAYDSKRRQLAGVYTRGGTRFTLLDFDTLRWLGDSASIDNAWATNSFTYDSEADRYVGLIDGGGLLFISGDGATLKATYQIANKLPYLSRFVKDSYDLSLHIIAWGDTIAFVRFEWNTVAQIWEYDMRTQTIRMTYWNGVLPRPDF